MKRSNFFGLFSNEELEVASILLELHSSVREAETARGFSFSWATRKRSVLRRKKKSTASIDPSQSLRPQSSPPLCATANLGPAPFAEKAEAASPNTPLLFATIDADEKRQSSKTKASRKSKKGELMETENELTRYNIWLKREEENVKKYRLRLETMNLQFQASQQALVSFGYKFLQKPPEMSGILPSVGHQDQSDQQHRPWMVHQRAGNQLGMAQSHNVVDGPQMLEQSLAKSMAYALARQRRKEIYKSKNSNASKKLISACR